MQKPNQCSQCCIICRSTTLNEQNGVVVKSVAAFARVEPRQDCSSLKLLNVHIPGGAHLCFDETQCHQQPFFPHGWQHLWAHEFLVCFACCDHFAVVCGEVSRSVTQFHLSSHLLRLTRCLTLIVSIGPAWYQKPAKVFLYSFAF